MKVRCTKCKKLFVNNSNYKGQKYKCRSCLQILDQPEPKIINFQLYSYPPPPDYAQVNKGCGYCHNAMWILMDPIVDQNGQTNSKDVRENAWLLTLTKNQKPLNRQFLLNYLVIGLDIINPFILTPLFLSLNYFPVIIYGIPEYQSRETPGGQRNNPWHPGYYDAYFTHRYPTKEEYSEIKQTYPDFHFGKPNPLYYHGN